MPNWVRNKLTISGHGAESIMTALTSTDEDGERIFDFNKIIAMPESLKIISGSVTSKSVILYLVAINPSAPHYGNQSDKLSFTEYAELLDKLKAKGSLWLNIPSEIPSLETLFEYEKLVIGNDHDFCTGATPADVIAYGKRAVDNVLEYGHMDWYGWANENWGTKWNACDSYFYDTTVEFSTAWSDVCELICKLSKQYPDNTFYYDFAEEQAGLYAGEYTFENGEEVAGCHFEQESKEAYEKYFEHWGGEEDYQYNERTRTYEYMEDDNDKIQENIGTTKNGPT